MRGRFESLLSWLPFIGVVVWVLAGRWQQADFQTRNWMVFVSMLCLGLLFPVPSSRAATRVPGALIVGLGWVLLVGLVHLSR